MENRVKVVMENFHQIIEEQNEHFKAQPKVSEFFKKFNDLKPYKSCPGKQDSKLKGFFLLVNPKMNGCFLENAKTFSNIEIVDFWKFCHLLNQANKKFKIEKQLLLNMLNTKLDIDLNEK